MLLQAAKWMTKELFHGRHHPKNQEIEICEQFMFQILSGELSSFIQRHCSVSKSGKKHGLKEVYQQTGYG